MNTVRQTIGGVGNLMFKEAFIIGKVLDGEIPDIYLQSEKYWSEYAYAIKKKFSEGIVKNDKVAVHIRRGDYLNTDFYVDLSKTDYYQKALALFPDDSFLVFCKDNQGTRQDSEDHYWCDKFLENLIPNRYTFSPYTNSETDDLNMMAGGKARIGANSSFSWWGCYLGEGQNIMPKQWYSDGIERTECPSEWMRI